jgi:hypothetical protein
LYILRRNGFNQGYSEYVDKATALSNNLTFSNRDTFILRADYRSVVSGGGGRKSVRLESHAKYKTHAAV